MPEFNENHAQAQLVEYFAEYLRKNPDVVMAVLSIHTDCTVAEQSRASANSRHAQGLLDTVPEGSRKFKRGGTPLWPPASIAKKTSDLHSLRLRAASVVGNRFVVIDFGKQLLAVTFGL